MQLGRGWVRSKNHSGKCSNLLETNNFPKKSSRTYWYQCTVKGGREGRDVDVLQLAQTVEKLGAGEILLNCIDKDGTNSGFDIAIINHIRDNVTIPVIASSGAGKVEHFSEVFEETDVQVSSTGRKCRLRQLRITCGRKG